VEPQNRYGRMWLRRSGSWGHGRVKTSQQLGRPGIELILEQTAHVFLSSFARLFGWLGTK